MNSNRVLLVGLILSLGLIVIARHKLDAKHVWAYPPLNTLVVSDHFSQDVGILSQGSHVVAGNLAYIQLLQYYGDSQNAYEGDEHHHHDHDGHDHHGHGHQSHEDEKTGQFIRLKDYGRRLIRINPFFNVGALEVGGSLAFNLNRDGEALNFLDEAIELDPSYFRYHLYVSAILYRSERKDAELIAKLNEAIEYPDCPPLLESILAKLNIKNGNYLRAAEVFVHMIKTIPSEAERKEAERQLIALIQAQPQIADQVRPLL